MKAKAPTTAAVWILTAIRALDARGIDGKGVAVDAGIDTRVLQELDARIKFSLVRRFWELAIEATGDSTFGLDLPRFMTPGTGSGLGYAVLASSSVADGLGRFARFYALITDAVKLRIERDEKVLTLSVERYQGWEVPDPPIDAAMAAMLGVVRLVAPGKSVVPLRVLLRRPAPQSTERFDKLFRCEIVFSADTDRMEFSREVVERPVPEADAETARQADRNVSKALGGLDVKRIDDRVRATLIAALPGRRPNQSEIARALGMSSRSLQQRLAEQGTTYSEVLDRTREALARDYLKGRSHSIKEIAFLLGFADTATFSRAFKRWTGVAPTRG